MRNTAGMIRSFMPLHEREYESRLFIDEAIKGETERTLEMLARALSGHNEIKFDYRHEREEYHENTEHIQGDNKKWITVTKHYRIEAKMREFAFYGNSECEIWLKLIDFWAVNQTIFPCGAASFNRTEKKSK